MDSDQSESASELFIFKIGSRFEIDEGIAKVIKCRAIISLFLQVFQIVQD